MIFNDLLFVLRMYWLHKIRIRLLISLNAVKASVEKNKNGEMHRTSIAIINIIQSPLVGLTGENLLNSY